MRAMVEDTPGGAENLWTMVVSFQEHGSDVVETLLVYSLSFPSLAICASLWK